MPTTTTNFSLNKPLVNDPIDEDLWGGQLNTNMDKICILYPKKYFKVQNIPQITLHLYRRPRTITPANEPKKTAIEKNMF